MNLSDIRDRVFSQVDWAPTQSADALARVDAFINRAYYQLAIDAPFLFFQDRLLVVTQADVKPQEGLAAGADTVAVRPADPWVLRRSVSTVDAGVIDWDETGLWRGRMLEVTDPSGQVHRHRIRDIWTSADWQYISLYRPWHNVTDSGMTYRIYTDDYSLPNDLIEVNSLRIAKSNQNWPLDIIGELEAEKLSLDDSPSQVSAGIPRVAWRRRHRKMVSDPTYTPGTLLVDLAGWAWVGPEPTGTFSYIFTWYWGIRDPEDQTFGPSGDVQSSVNAFDVPLWESAPSPISAQAIVPDVDVEANGRAVRVTTPNISQMMGFNETGKDRLNRTGIRKRIYRRRHTATGTNYTSLPNAETNGAIIETPDKYFLVADIPGHQVTWDDTGVSVPDYRVPISETHGYETFTMYPRPDQRYEIQVRCLRRPAKLVDPEDTPSVHLDATEVLIWRTLLLLYESMGNADMADRATAYYQQHLKKATDRYSDLRYPEEPMLRRPGRAQQVVDTRRPWRRWYNLP